MTAGDKKSDLNKAGVKAIKAIGKDDGTKDDPNAKFTVELAQDANQIKDEFTAKKLEKYRAVIFLDTAAAALLNDEQKAAFEAYFHAGGGFLGIGSAIETEPALAVLHRLLGTRASTTLSRPHERRRHHHQGGRARAGSPPAGRSRSTPAPTASRRRSRPSVLPEREEPGVTLTAPLTKGHASRRGGRSCRGRGSQSATIKVADRVHDATKNLPGTGTGPTLGTTSRPTSAASRTSSPRSSRIRSARSLRAQVLDGIAGGTMGADHPVSWCKDYKGGRSFYTALGNTAESFDEADSGRTSRARSTGRPACPIRSTATAARPCSRTTSRSRSAGRRT